MDPNTGQYLHRYITLETGLAAKVSVAVNERLPEDFYSYRTPWLRRRLGVRKYFVLEYTAVVGDKRYLVATVY